jgi:hypothetical protein
VAADAASNKMHGRDLPRLSWMERPSIDAAKIHIPARLDQVGRVKL